MIVNKDTGSDFERLYRILFWVVFALLSISAMPNKDFRFMLPIIPSIALVTGMGGEAFLSRVEKKESGFNFS